MIKWIKPALLSLGALIFTTPSHAYLSLMTTGDILKENQIQAMGYVEHIFNKYDGSNLNVRGSLGLTEDLQADIEVGIGELDIMIAGFVKWVPIPDVDNQPAVGVRAGLAYINEDDFSQTSIIAMPFLSKAFPSPHGKFAPYAGLPLGINSNDDDTDFTARLAVGTEWTHPDYTNVHALAEVDFGLSKSFSSINVGGSYDF